MSVRNHVKGREYEADFIHVGGYCCAFGVRDHAGHACMPRWNHDPGSDALSAAAATAATAAHDGDLPGWNSGERRHSVPDASASAAAATAAPGQVGRTRLICNKGRRSGVASFKPSERRRCEPPPFAFRSRNGALLSSLSGDHNGETMMRRFALLLAVTVAVSSCAHNLQPLTEPAFDMSSPLYGPNFLHIATSANLWEIESSRLALQVSANPAVRSFAEMIIADHTWLAGNMTAAGKAAGALPAPPEALMPLDQAKIDQLRATPATVFDGSYRDMQVAAHQQAISLFRTYAAQGDNPILRTMASRTIPMLERHLAAAEALPVTTAVPSAYPPSTTSQRGERG